MLRIDDQYFSHAEWQSDLADLEKLFAAKNFPVTRLAVCTHNTLDWLLLVFYCREHNIALAPLHGDTPFATAMEKSKNMHCDALWWQNRDGLQSTGANASCARPGVLIQMSSGTTGAPKLVERAWQEIDEEIHHYNLCIDMPAHITPVVACSITHSYGLICGVLATLVRGGEPHIVTSWNPKYVLRVVHQHQQPVLYSAPAFIYSLVQLLPGEQKLYGVMTSGMVLPALWFNAIKNKVQHLWQQYGCSEAGCITIAKNPKEANVIGLPLPHLKLQLHFSDETNLENRAIGELNVQLNDKVIHTRDLVYQNAHGEWVFCSRLDDTVIVSGMNVYPAEVEDVLAQMSGVEDVVVFRLQDDLVGQRIAAIYTGASDLSARDMRAWCAQFLPRHQWPSHWQRVMEIPKLPSGKISRKMLAELDLAALKINEVA